MKTIKGLIAAGLAETEAARRIRRDENMSRVYAEYPELREIDSRIIDIRKDRLIAMIDHDERLAKRYDIEENNLISKREQIISDNDIVDQLSFGFIRQRFNPLFFGFLLLFEFLIFMSPDPSEFQSQLHR